jgi:hypothetical protein
MVAASFPVPAARKKSESVPPRERFAPPLRNSQTARTSQPSVVLVRFGGRRAIGTLVLIRRALFRVGKDEGFGAFCGQNAGESNRCGPANCLTEFGQPLILDVKGVRCAFGSH